MKKHIDRDLLKILKTKNKNELFYTLLNMANGTYNYEIEYLNKLPRKLIEIYLEKIILVVNKKRSLNSYEEVMNAVLKFCNNIDVVDVKDLNKNILINLDTYLKAQKYKSYSEELRDNAIKVYSFILATAIFCALMMPKKEKNKPEVDPDITISSTKPEETIPMDIVITIPEEPEESIKEDNTIPTETKETTSPQKEEQNDILMEPSNEEKEEYILHRYNLTQDEFDVVAAIAMAEAKYNSYEDTYNVINTIYNRTISKKWNKWVSSWRNDETGEIGRSLFIQATQSSQFIVYENKRFEQYLGVKEGEPYQAIIDFLYTETSNHNYLCFRSASTNVEGANQLVEDGNKYFDELTEEDRLELGQDLKR